MNVLLIDDDAGVRKSFSRVLQRSGFEVTAVETGADAMTELRKQSFQVVVCDIILLEADGTSVYEELRDEFPAMANRVLFVTGWTGDEKVTRLLEYTGRPYLTKPVELEELVTSVRQVADDAEASPQETSTTPSYSSNSLTVSPASVPDRESFPA